MPEPAGRGSNREKLTVEQRGRLLASRAASLFSLQEKLAACLEEHALDRLYYNLELPLTAVLAAMERQGIAVDLQLLHDLTAEIRSRIDHLEARIYALAGESFNLNSPQQMATILLRN